MDSKIQEEIREIRLVRVGLLQHSIVMPTSSSVKIQRDAIYQKIESYINYAAVAGVQILCLQEAWSM